MAFWFINETNVGKTGGEFVNHELKASELWILLSHEISMPLFTGTINKSSLTNH